MSECNLCNGNHYVDGDLCKCCDDEKKEMLEVEVPFAIAKAIVTGSRREQYGDDCIPKIAERWKRIFGEEVTPADVCRAMIDLKLARLEQDPLSKDSAIDIMGYGAWLWVYINEMR